MSFSEDFDFSTCINKELEGTKTQNNLKEAFCGESQARNKYNFFAQKARKEGLIRVADIFDKTAENEKEHAKIWLKLLYGGDIPNTKENLRTAAQTESYEWQDMYANFAKDAKEEGFDKIAALFESVRNIEKMHMTRYNKLLAELEDNTYYLKDTPVLWECSKCGYRFEREQAPDICPFCKHPKEYFFTVNPE